MCRQTQRKLRRAPLLALLCEVDIPHRRGLPGTPMQGSSSQKPLRPQTQWWLRAQGDLPCLHRVRGLVVVEVGAPQWL